MIALAQADLRYDEAVPSVQAGSAAGDALAPTADVTSLDRVPSDNLLTRDGP